MAAEPRVDGFDAVEGRAARRLAADREALVLRACDVCGWLVRARFEVLVLRVLLGDPPVRSRVDLGGFADVRGFAGLPALAAPLRFGAAVARFFLIAFADPAFAERFFAAFAMSLPPG